MTVSNSELLHYLERINNRLAQIHASVVTLEVNMAGELEAVRTEVEQMRTVQQGAVTLLDGLAAQIDSLKNDPAALTALAEDIRAQRTGLAEALVRDTRASDEPAPST